MNWNVHKPALGDDPIKQVYDSLERMAPRIIPRIDWDDHITFQEQPDTWLDMFVNIKSEQTPNYTELRKENSVSKKNY